MISMSFLIFTIPYFKFSLTFHSSPNLLEHNLMIIVLNFSSGVSVASSLFNSLSSISSTFSFGHISLSFHLVFVY